MEPWAAIAFLGTSFFLGIAGGWHCVVMCGPIASISASRVNSRFFINQIGKLSGYAILATLLFLGLKSIELASGQRYISLLLGGILFVVLLFQFSKGNGWLAKIGPLILRPFNQINKIVPFKSPLGAYVRGLVNGFLPCGLSYAAISAAALAESFYLTILSVLIFGMATSLWLSVSVSLTRLAGVRFQYLMPKIRATMLIVSVALLVSHGWGAWNFSPKVSETNNNQSHILCPVPSHE